MRIIAGKLKSISLKIIKNKNTRPLKDLVKESIFNLLTHSNKILFKFENSTILDLYSGTGSFGLECLSRGSDIVYFVEKNKEALQILEHNIKNLNMKNNTKVYSSDVFSIIKKENLLSKFDLIFCDPPFKNRDVEKLIELIFAKKLLKNDGIVVLHRKRNTPEEISKYLKIIDERIYGISKIVFGKVLA